LGTGREATCVTVALAGHTGPWTPDNVEALPDAGNHARLEVYEGGVLVVHPAPGVAHQRASYWLHRALAEAATAAGADAEVLGAVNVALPGNKLLVPDVVVVAVDAISETTTRLPCEAVLAVVEVVSPSMISMERAIKPAMYAEADIPVYWRVKLQDTPKIVVSSLSRGSPHRDDADHRDGWRRVAYRRSARSKSTVASPPQLTDYLLRWPAGQVVGRLRCTGGIGCAAP
jgi:Uma2 family endonuclease